MINQLKIRNNDGCNKKWISFLRNNVLLKFTPICHQKSSHSIFEVLVWQIPKSCLRHSRNSYSMFTLDGILFCNLYDHKNLYSHYETNFASCGFVSNTLGSKKVAFKHFLRCNVGKDANYLFLKLQCRKIHSNVYKKAANNFPYI